MKHLSLRSYRVPLSPDELNQSAKNLLEKAQTETSLQLALNWEDPQSIALIKNGFPPEPSVPELNRLFKEVQKQKKLKKQRVQNGYLNFKTPRKGLKGWLQKKRDVKEIALPIAYHLFECLADSQRLALLSAMHDSLVSQIMTSEPREVPLEDLLALPHPITEMISTLDSQKIKQLLTALATPLHKVDPQFLIENVQHYVHYQVNRGFAYYYA